MKRTNRPCAEARRIRVAGVACALLALAGASFAGAEELTTTVGATSNPGALPQAVSDAYRAGARHIVIRPGVYVLPTAGHASFTLDGWKDVTISAYRVTLISSENKRPGDVFDIRHCENVTLEGPILSQTGLTSYQGRVVAIGTAADGKAYADWRPDTGYPIPPADSTKFPGSANVVDSKTRKLKIGVGDFYNAPMETLDARTFRVHFKSPTLNFAVGDWLIGRYGDAPFKVFLDDSRNCTVRDITMMRNGFAPLREDHGGGNLIQRMRWALGPKPAGATEEPLVTNAADGFHSTGAYPGPVVEACVFEGVFLDDCIAIHGGFAKIVEATPDTITLDKGRGALRVGEPARISNDKGFFAEALVKAIVDNPDKTATVTLDKALNVPVGAKVGNPRVVGAGYLITGCHLGDTRSRGILVKADNGLIKDNVIERCGMSAVSIGPEYYWNEADYAWNVTVDGNTMRGNGPAGYGGACVLVHGDGALGNRNIVIRGNRFEANVQGDIDGQWVEGLTIAKNRMVGAARVPAGMRQYSSIALANVRGVALTGNVVENAAAYKTPLIALGENVADVRHNDAVGIRDATASTEVLATPRMTAGSPGDPNIRYTGRWDRTETGIARSYWGGAYFRVGFTGTSVGLNIPAGGPVIVSIDDAPLRAINAGTGVTPLNVAPLGPGAHSLLVASEGQNAEMAFAGMQLDTGAVTKPIPARPIVEFVGDSITTGGGPKGFSTVNYAWETGEALHADHVQIAFSARALTTGFGCAVDKAALDTQYFALKNFNHLDDRPQTPWDMSYTPRIICINLGQNDQCGGEPPATMTASYVSFVRKLQVYFPHTEIALLRPFGGPFAAAVRSAVDLLIAGGDTRVRYIDTEGWLEKTDYVDGVHPTPAGHAKVAARLTPLLKEILARP
jgi:lysophospholipase L1-like esterase